MGQGVPLVRQELEGWEQCLGVSAGSGRACWGAERRKDLIGVITDITTTSRSQYRLTRDSRKHKQPCVVVSGKERPIPPVFSSRLSDLTNKCLELFRHYWSCFPLTTKTKDKLQRLEASLTQCYSEVCITFHLHPQHFGRQSHSLSQYVVLKSPQPLLQHFGCELATF